METQQLRADWERAQADLGRLREAVGRAYLGGERLVELLLCSLLAGGHALIQGAPGLGKTTLARALAEALNLRFRRIQFTPDLMPADVLGVRMLVEDEQGRRRFEFEPGPIFSQVLLADEINRASPRTQSALLEAMQEQQVTVHGERRALEAPFMVVATQNPIEMEGTYPLPEAQLDRFMVQIDVPAPTESEIESVLRASLDGPGASRPAPSAVMSADDVLRLRGLVRQITCSASVLQQIATVVCATRPEHPRAPEAVRANVRLGVSPRGAQAWLWVARARAMLHGRLHVADEDLDACAAAALAHRLSLSYQGLAAEVERAQIVRAALDSARAKR